MNDENVTLTNVILRTVFAGVGLFNDVVIRAYDTDVLVIRG